MNFFSNLKIKCYVCMLVMIFLLSGCGDTEKKPDGMSDRVYDLGIAALETTDDFLNGDIEADEAARKLVTALTSIQSEIAIHEEEIGGALVGTDYWQESLVESRITLIQFRISEKNSGRGSNKDVIQQRNSLAELLNEKKR